jgi:hypothetical protein
MAMAKDRFSMLSIHLPSCEDHTLMVFLPFIDVTFNRISKVMSKHNIKTMELSPRKLSSVLHPVKNHLALKMPGVYSIPWECRKVYIVQTGR